MAHGREEVALRLGLVALHVKFATAKQHVYGYHQRKRQNRKHALHVAVADYRLPDDLQVAVEAVVPRLLARSPVAAFRAGPAEHLAVASHNAAVRLVHGLSRRLTRPDVRK